MADRPAIVYKYEGIDNNSLSNLKAQSLYFGSPSGFNDPYDCAITATIANPLPDQVEVVRKHFLNVPDRSFINIRQLESMPFEILKEQIIRGAINGLNDAREDFLKKRGVTCFSELNDNLLMWAHYGGQYQGFCLAFDTSKAPFTKLRQVQYVEKIPKVDVVEFLVHNNNDRLLDTLFCTKSKNWKYEKEWRAIHKEAGTLFTYEANSLKAIYFGPDIDRHLLETICLTIQSQNPNVDFYEGKLSTTEFKVEFSNFTYTSFIDAKRKRLL